MCLDHLNHCIDYGAGIRTLRGITEQPHEGIGFCSVSSKRLCCPSSVFAFSQEVPNSLVERDFNPEVFINGNGNGYEDRIDEIIEKIIEIDRDDPNASECSKGRVF